MFKEEKRKKVADITNIIAIILLYAGGLEALQAVSVLSSFPFVFIIILMTIQFFKFLTADKRLKI
nr:BCCT family transporter [Vagococcus fluvialis]